jgi:hypothetical protein
MQLTASQKSIDKNKKCKERKEKVPSASLGFRVESLLDDATLVSLGDDDFFLYQMLMAQLDNEALVFNFSNKMFGYDGSVQVFVTNFIKLMKRAWLNVLIIQIFCM